MGKGAVVILAGVFFLFTGLVSDCAGVTTKTPTPSKTLSI